MAETTGKWKAKWQAFRERSGNLYRLVIMNDETFAEVGSYRLTLFNVYVWVSTLFVILAVLLFLAIAYTPIKYYIPGYMGTKGDNRAEIASLAKTIKELEADLANQQAYTANVLKALNKQVETADDVPKVDPDLQDQTEEAAPSEQEIANREAVNRAQSGPPASGINIQRTASFSPGNKSLAEMHFAPPLKGRVTKEFNLEDSHLGIDVVAPKDSPIKAAMDGYVFFADWTTKTGNTIGIQHGNNTVTFYMHNAQLLKKKGSHVKSGEAVAIIGNTGTQTDGPHLHFELWHRGQAVDPRTHIDF